MGFAAGYKEILCQRDSPMSMGDLVCYREDIGRFFIVIDTKKYYYGYKNRVRVLCPKRGSQWWFLQEDLEVLSESR